MGAPNAIENRRTAHDWIEVAIDELGRNGPTAVKIDHLAKRLNRSKGGFYAHFTNRDDLNIAIARHIQEADKIQRIDYQTSDPAQATALLRRLFDFAYTLPTVQHAFYHLTCLPPTAELTEIVAQTRRDRIATYEQLCLTIGAHPDDAHHRAVAMHNAFIGHHSLTESNPEHRATPEYVIALKQLLIPTPPA